MATYPTVYGECVAVRFDAPDGRLRPLGELGFELEIAEALIEAIEQPEGVVLLTGPSGSGKTTTLYSCLQHLVESGPERTRARPLHLSDKPSSYWKVKGYGGYFATWVSLHFRFVLRATNPWRADVPTPRFRT